MTLKEHLKTQTRLYIADLYAECLGDMNEIARKSNISLATLYRHLPRSARGVYHPVPLKLNDGKSPADKLRFFGVSYAVQRNNPDWKKIYVTAHKNFRARIKNLHPDATSSTAQIDMYRKVTQAWEHVERYLKSKM